MSDLLRGTWYLYGRHMRATLRLPVWIVVSISQPILWLLLYGQLFRKVVEIPGFGGGSYIQFLTPGIVIMTTLFGSAWAGMGMLEDMRIAILERLLTTPVARTAIILSRVLQAATSTTVQALIILILSAFLGARAQGGFLGILEVLLAGLILGGTFAAISNGIALIFRKEETLIAVLNFATLPLTFISATLMSQLLMPSWMQTAARFNPVNWAVLAARAALSGGAASIVWLSMLKLFILLCAGIAFATWAFSRYRAAA